MSSIISLRNIVKTFSFKTVLDHISLEIEEGDYISIIGASGAGKSTLLNIIGALDIEYEGEYLFEGDLIDRKKCDSFRNRNIGFIFQSFNLIPGLTAKENAILPYTYYRGNIDSIEEKTREYFDIFGMSNQYNQLTSTLSGGEKQRIALIRSLILNPKVLLADEPTGNLDSENSALVQEFLKSQNEYGKTIIVVTHDDNMAKSANRCYRINEGSIYEE